MYVPVIPPDSGKLWGEDAEREDSALVLNFCCNFLSGTNMTCRGVCQLSTDILYTYFLPITSLLTLVQ